MNDLVVSLIAVIAILCACCGTALGLNWGKMKQVEMLENLLNHGKPGPVPAGRTIMPDTAESRIDVSAKMVEEAYAKETIETGVAHLEALCVSEGRAVPSKKELEKEVLDMLGRSGTQEAGVHV